MFITVEGIEGVGKSTQLKTIAQALEQAAIPYIVTREPGGTPLGEGIRALFLEFKSEQPVPLAELLLIFAARAQHVARIIQPALEQNYWVLCDRFSDSTYAYQGGGRGLNKQLIQEMEGLVLGDFKPDHTLIFDAPVALGLERVQSRILHARLKAHNAYANIEKDRIESEKIVFFEAVRAAYQLLALQHPTRCTLIDASLDLATVHRSVLATINPWIAAWLHSHRNHPNQTHKQNIVLDQHQTERP